MDDYQLTVLGAEERLTPVQTPEVEERHEQSCLFAFPETMPGQLALPDEKGDCDGER